MTYYENKMAARHPKTSCDHGVKLNMWKRDARYCPKCSIETAERSLKHAKENLAKATLRMSEVSAMVAEHPDPWNGGLGNKPEWLK